MWGPGGSGCPPRTPGASTAATAGSSAVCTGRASPGRPSRARQSWFTGAVMSIPVDDGVPQRAPVPFVVGVGRSGTTLLRLMLDAHPDLAIPPETPFLPDLIEAARRPDSHPENLARVIIEHRRRIDFERLSDEELRLAFAAVRPLEPAGVLRAFYGAYAVKEGKARYGD